MPQPRRNLVSLADTPFYHCIGRCVRRAFLCGKDLATGADFEHRRQWVVDRLAFLEQVFAINVCAYAVMSNHFHVVLHLDQQTASSLSDAEVMARWSRLYALPVLLARYQQGELTSEAELERAREQLEERRARLGSLSWFMRCLNEHIARRANAEDGCTGRFWEGRFKSQALLDEAALLTCMSYVDLNPVRARMAATPEDSDYTSVQERIKRERTPFVLAPKAPAPVQLMPFQANEATEPGCLPFAFTDYLELIDWTGRAVLENKRGAIAETAPPILQRLGISPDRYLARMHRCGNGFGKAMGRVEALRAAAKRLQQQFLCGVSEARLLFGESSPG